MTVQSAFTLDFEKALDPPQIAADADVVRLANGGFALVGEKAGTLFGATYDASGDVVKSWTGIPGVNATITQLDNGKILVVSEGDFEIFYTLVDSITGAVDTTTMGSVIQDAINADVAATSNGLNVTAVQGSIDDDSVISFHVRSNQGTNLTFKVIDHVEGDDDTDPSVAVLANGNIAIAWTRTDNDTNESAVVFQIFDQNGDAVGGQDVTDFGTINRNPSIVARPAHASAVGPEAAGFAIAFETNSRFTGSVDIQLDSYDASGNFVDGVEITNQFFNQTGEGDGTQNSDPHLAASPDGNLAVSYVRDGKNHVLTAVSDSLKFNEIGNTEIDFANQDDGQLAPVVTFFGTGQLAAFHTDSKLLDLKGEHVFGFRDSFSDDDDDSSTGDDFIDLMNGTGGTDTLFGGRNDDTLQGGDGADTLHGGEGDDTLVGDGNFGEFDLGDTLFGDAGNDALVGEAGDDTLDGGVGNDNMSGNSGNDTFFVDNLADQVFESGGEGKADVVAARATHALTAGSEIETLRTTSNGGTTAIDLTGNALKQTIIGNAGVNVLSTGGIAADTMQGLGGNDIYRVYNSADVVVEGATQGTADRVAAAVDYLLKAGVFVEQLTTNGSSGTSGIDLTGNSLKQEIIGNAGVNILHDGGTGAADTIKGLGGNDIYRVFNSGDVIIEAAAQGNTDTVIAAVNYALNGGADIAIIKTNSGSSTAGLDLTGNEFVQEIIGDTGSNILDGKGGSDILRGSGGKDFFVFSTALGAGNIDTIADFGVAADTVRLENTIFTALATTGTLAAAAFRANTTGLAGDSSDRIIYETDTGKLFFDANGSAAGAGIHFATLATGLALTNTDFVVI